MSDLRLTGRQMARIAEALRNTPTVVGGDDATPDPLLIRRYVRHHLREVTARYEAVQAVNRDMAERKRQAAEDLGLDDEG